MGAMGEADDLAAPYHDAPDNKAWPLSSSTCSRRRSPGSERRASSTTGANAEWYTSAVAPESDRTCTISGAL